LPSGTAIIGLRFRRDNMIQKNETTQPTMLNSTSNSHSRFVVLLSLVCEWMGSHISKITIPNAIRAVTTNLKGFFRISGAFRRGPRRSPINTVAAIYSTGVLKNHS
jgi:hypothetical protein